MQQQRVGFHFVHDLAHSAELFIQFSAFHACIFLAFVMREDAIAHFGSERSRRDEHPGLHHEVGKADAAQEGRFASRIGAGNDNDVLVTGIEVVTDDCFAHAQCE